MQKVFVQLILVFYLQQFDAQNIVQIVNDTTTFDFQSRIKNEIITRIFDESIYAGVYNKSTDEIKMIKIENSDIVKSSEPFLNSKIESFNYTFFSNNRSLFIKSTPNLFVHFLVKNNKVIFFSNFLVFDICSDEIDTDLMFDEVMKLFRLDLALKKVFSELK